MNQLFGKDHAASYDRRWEKLSTIMETLHLLSDFAFQNLPPKARVLCVGAGTGAEVIALAKKNPEWKFTLILCLKSKPMTEQLLF